MKKETVEISIEVDEDVRNKANEILKQLGITEDLAINIFLRQVVFHRGIPFPVVLPENFHGEN